MSVSLVIKSLGGTGASEFSVDVPTAATVEELKEQIASRVGFPKEHVRLVCAGRVWENVRTVGSYEVSDGAVAHCLNNPPRTPPQAATQSLAPAHPVQTMLGQLPPDPMRQMMQQQLAQNPEIIQNMMRSPFVQQMMSSPETLQALVRMSPELRQIVEERPQIGRMLEDPEMVQQSMRMIANPSIMREWIRTSDQATGRMNLAPRGQATVRRAEREVVDPLLTALSGNSEGAVASANAGTYTQTTTEGAPSTDVLPNPWVAPAPALPAATTPATTTPASAAAAAPSAVISASALEAAVAAPATSQSAHQNAGTGQANSLATMMQHLMSNPGMTAQLQQMMSSPVMAHQLSQMLSGGSGSPAPPADAVAGTMGSGAVAVQAAAHAHTPASGGPTYVGFHQMRFAPQLAQLASMGFTDEARCLHALQQHNGRVDAAIDSLLCG